MNPLPTRLDDLGDVLSVEQFCAVMGKGRGWYERLLTLQNKTGVMLLPKPIPEMPRRFTREAVKAWLKKGPADKKVAKELAGAA